MTTQSSKAKPLKHIFFKVIMLYKLPFSDLSFCNLNIMK